MSVTLFDNKVIQSLQSEFTVQFESVHGIVKWRIKYPILWLKITWLPGEPWDMAYVCDCYTNSYVVQ